MNMMEFRIKRTVEQYKGTINNVHSKQVKFAKDFTDMVYNNSTKKIDVIIARCGMGKSVLIKSILNNMVNDYTFIGKEPSREIILSDNGAILITDSLERLEEVMESKGLEDRCYLMKNDFNVTEYEERKNFQTKIIESFKFPILLMTTQRYFSLDENDREFMYTWAKGKRKVAFIDEKPILTHEDIIDEKFLSEIRIAIHECYEGEDKKYLLDTFDKIYSDLDYIRKNYSLIYEEMWLKSSKKSLLINEDEDKKFFDILAKNIKASIYKNVETLKRIYTDGCLFVSKKDKNQDNIRQFIVLNDNTNKFDTNKCKYFILDATAKYDIDYIINEDIFNFVEIDDKKEIKDITIHYIPFNTSKNNLNNNKDSIEMISNYINKIGGEKSFVATYGKKCGIYQKFEKLLNTKEMGYFGAIKGRNDWADLSTMFHIGFNRQSDITYLLTYIYIKKLNNAWNNQSDEEIINKINGLIDMKKGMFTDTVMYTIMQSKILVDAEQNIMRIKCRNFSNNEMCHVFIITGSNFKGYISRLVDKLNTKLIDCSESLPREFEEYKIMNRRSSDEKETIPQKILRWINDTWDGSQIKTKDVLISIGITQKQFNKAKEKNSGLKDILNKYQIKKGVYSK